MKALWWSALWLLAAGAWAAETPVQKMDFAYGLPLDTAGGAAIYRLALPGIVYAHLAGKDYGDLRVFNAAGEVVPHSLRRPDEPEAATGEPQPVPFFPYSLVRPGESGPARVQVTINDQGTVVSSSTSAVIDAAERISAYLIDVSALQQAPSSLVFDWESPQDSFVAHVGIEGSDDLDRWHPLVSQASLVRLVFAGRELGRNEIDLPGRAYKYLKISWPTATAGVRLTGVKVRVTQQAGPVARHWVELTGAAVDNERNAFDYRIQGRLPVDRAELRLPEQNSLIDVKLSSRDGETAPWRLRHSGSFYRLQVDGAALASEPARFGQVNDTRWRLEAVSDLSGLGAAVPVLRLGYAQHDLYFLARGEPPFVLAFGAYQAPEQRGEIDALLARLDDRTSETFIAEAGAGDMMTLGGMARLQAPSAPFPWQRIALWAVLVTGVLVLGILAWRLGRQMRQS
ncbi:MAG: DUF3999 domain-containing protein [Gammaproteobacteria bacterium]